MFSFVVEGFDRWRAPGDAGAVAAPPSAPGRLFGTDKIERGDGFAPISGIGRKSSASAAIACRNGSAKKSSARPA